MQTTMSERAVAERSRGGSTRLRWILAGSCLLTFVLSMIGLCLVGRADPLRPLTDLRILIATFGLPCLVSLVAATLYARRAQGGDDRAPGARG